MTCVYLLMLISSNYPPLAVRLVEVLISGAFVLLVGVAGLGDGVLGTIGFGWSSSSSELSSSDSEGMCGDGGAVGFDGGCRTLPSATCSS